ncbi:HipA N-terminal domain-containing protein [Legionella pneumophila]|nr:HipA N-terminal domain-containing protein [Legionella pneumophila]
MRKAYVSVSGIKAGILEELQGGTYQFTYFEDYHGAPVSLTMPLKNKVYDFDVFPLFLKDYFLKALCLKHYYANTR